MVSRHPLAMFQDRLVMLRINILIKRTSESSVYHLVSPAYSHNRELPVGCQTEESEVIFIAERIHVLQLGDRLFAQEKRINIPAPGHQQAIQAFDYGSQGLDISYHRYQNRSTPGLQDRLYIILRNTRLSRVIPVRRNANARRLLLGCRNEAINLFKKLV